MVYGFGSAFAQNGAVSARANDIDLLIVHPDTDVAACKFAIFCKRRLTDFSTRADITMLSDVEERHCQFIKMSRAVCVGAIHEDQVERDLQAVCAVISSHEGSYD